MFMESLRTFLINNLCINMTNTYLSSPCRASPPSDPLYETVKSVKNDHMRSENKPK